MRSEQLCGDGLVDEMLRLRGMILRPRAHQVCWYHPALWPGYPSEPSATAPQFVPGCVAYQSTLRPSSTATS